MQDSTLGGPHRGQKALFLQYTNPAGYPPLEHVSRILARQEWTLVFLGTRVGESVSMRFPDDPHVTVRLIGSVTRGWLQKLHYAAYVAGAIAYAAAWRPRWLYASEPLSCLPGLIISRVLGIRVVYHEHDAPAREAGTAFSRATLAARRKLAQIASVIVVPNEDRAAAFAAEHGLPASRVTCVLNCPSRSEAVEDLPLRDDKLFWLYYHGSVNAERLPAAVIRSLALLPEQVGIRIVGYETAGSRGYLSELRKVAKRCHISDHRVDIRGTKQRTEMLDLARASHVGLSLMPLRTSDANMAHMVGASNKPFDYLACGIPVLVSELPQWREIFVSPGYGLACDPESPESIAKAVRWWIEHPAELRTMGHRGRTRILDDWNYERQFTPVLGMLQGASIT